MAGAAKKFNLTELLNQRSKEAGEQQKTEQLQIRAENRQNRRQHRPVNRQNRRRHRPVNRRFQWQNLRHRCSHGL